MAQQHTLASLAPEEPRPTAAPASVPPTTLVSVSSSGRSEQTAELLRRAHAARAANDRETRDRLIEQVVVLNMAIAASIAHRYRSRGVAEDDLRQVAYLALTKAAQRFDDSTGSDFLSFAVPTIRGEVRRYFRDQGWTVRPTRRLQELQAAVFKAGARFSAEQGRSPRPSELAELLEEPLEDIEEALGLEGCFQPASLDRPVREDEGATVGDLLPDDDTDWDSVHARVLLAPVVRRLSERDRRIVMLRFFGDLSQREIAERIGVTQMQVSRLLTRILADLRRAVGELHDVSERAERVG